VGVFGTSDAHSGVYGTSGVTGVIGDGSHGHIGVEGISGDLYGVYGHVRFENPGGDMVGVFGSAGLADDLKTPIGKAGVFVGPVDVVGNLTVTGDQVVWGTKSAAAKHDDGSHRLLYCLESPLCQFEDFGEAKLIKGRAKVAIDPDFEAVADTRQYHVFLAPYGDSQGLYVSARHRHNFEVREQGGGSSNLTFSYRLVAKRKHVTAERFYKASRPAIQKTPPSLEAPNLNPAPNKPKGRSTANPKKKA
jgi:hypothetical protein